MLAGLRNRHGVGVWDHAINGYDFGARVFQHGHAKAQKLLVLVPELTMGAGLRGPPFQLPRAAAWRSMFMYQPVD